MGKDIVLRLMRAAKEQALKSLDPHSYMYPVLLSIIVNQFDFTKEEAGEFDGLLIQQWQIKKAKYEH